MKNAVTVVTLIAAAILAHSSADAAQRERVVSPGGIEAWFVQDSTVPLVAIEYSFLGGAAQDPATKPGVGNIVASILDEGAGDLDAQAFHERLERRAIEMSWSVSRDYFRGSMRMLKEHTNEAFDLLRLAFTSARFDKEPLERIRSQVISGLRRETTTPGSIASRKFWEDAFPGHPYGRPSNGTIESVTSIDQADLKDYARRVLARDNLKIAVVGDIDKATLGKLLDQTFGALPAKATLAAVPNATLAANPDKSFVTLDVPQTSVLFAGPGIRRDDKDFMAAFIVNHILGGGSMSSRLYREVREKRGLAYGVSESLIWMKHASLFIGSTATRSDKARDALDLIAVEAKRMGDEGPTQDELDQAKSYLKGSQLLSLDTSSKIAGALLQYQQDNLGIDYLEKRAALIDAVTLDDAKRVAKRLWGKGLLSVSVGRAQAAAAQPSPSPSAN